MEPDVILDKFNTFTYSSDEIRNSSEESKSTDEGSLDALMRDYDGYGTTPPRTRIHHKQMKKKICVSKLAKSLRRRSPAVSDHHADSEEDGSEARKKSDKRSIHLLRNSERNMKLNVDEMRESKEEQVTKLSAYKVESSSRFLSLNCTLVKAVKHWKSATPDACKSRSDFHTHLENIVKTGNNETKTFKTQISHENLWQTELKDLIWLELQAFIADRTVTQQDKYLCEARNAVPQLLDDILNYRFEKKQDKLSAQSVDSGVFLPPQDELAAVCTGCLGLFCPSCMEFEALALQEVGNLLSRLEAAEALFPSNKSFGSLFPLYNSPEFRSRVKAMCLWYNISRQLRLRTLIIGKQLMVYAQGSDVDSSIKSGESLGTPGTPGRFDWDLSDPGYCRPLRALEKIFFKMDGSDASPYRKFIEDVLKKKGLKKSFHFMEQLHLNLLRKARIALERPTSVENKNYSYLEETQLRRYGFWSDEYQSLNLPCFRPAFLFMSRIPFEIIHEFLRLRLETKLEKPSSLSIRQLMKELKEGLKFAVIVKERYVYHCEVALLDYDQEYKTSFFAPVQNFDATVQEIIKLYLNYLEQWVAITQFGKLQKNILEEEWKFITQTSPHFPGSEALCVTVFSNISCSVLKIIGDLIEEKIKALLDDYTNETEEEKIAPSVTPLCSSNLPHRKMLQLCRGLQALFIETRERTIHIVTLMKILVKHCEGNKLSSKKMDENNLLSNPLDCLRGKALKLCDVMKKEILLIESVIPRDSFDDNENFALQTRVREVIHQMYRYTFEYYKEIGRIVSFQRSFIQDMFQLTIGWLKFVKEFCEKGRGVRPRWANFGIEFILYISNPKFTCLLSEEEFAEFRLVIEAGVDYIKGCAQTSPALSAQSSHGYYRQSLSASDSSHNSNDDKADRCSLENHEKYKLCREDRMLEAVRKLDERMESKLREEELIGSVLSCSNTTNYDKKFIKPRSVTFVWQRGIKIGQGRFGKVYTAVNNDTGELMAMKEISLSPNDVRTIQNVATELKIFEGINHRNLVRYYGAEIHRDELLIFMELCPEGTLEGLIMASETGLPESIVRRYTKQLTHAVATLHEHSIVHRDIKPANIFLTSEGNKLKLGDFGSAVKIRAHTTAPGELKGFVGTQAYMAPEVFMKTNTVGHGRAADIWSLGCVVIEMASGKLYTWAQKNVHGMSIAYVPSLDVKQAEKSLARRFREASPISGIRMLYSALPKDSMLEMKVISFNSNGQLFQLSCGHTTEEDYEFVTNRTRPWAEYDSNYQIMFKVGMGETPEIPESLSEEGQDFVTKCIQHNPKKRATVKELLEDNFLKVECEEEGILCTMPSELEEYLKLGIKR